MRGMAAIIGLFIFCGMAEAATPYKHSLTVKNNKYLNEGVFTGGQAGHGSSLLGLRRSFSAKAELERIIVDLGDKQARPAGQNMGFFQASLDAKNSRIVLDLTQMRLSKITEQQIQKLFKNSPYVKSASLTLDPQDATATLVLELRRPLRLEVFQLLKDKMPARIVMDLKPLPGGKI